MREIPDDAPLEQALERYQAGQHRMVGLVQVGLVAVVLITSPVRGAVSVVLGSIYIVVALIATCRGPNIEWDSRVAGIGVLFWLMRAVLYAVMAISTGTIALWAGAVIRAGIAFFVGVYYRRALLRAGIFRRVDRLQEPGNDGD